MAESTTVKTPVEEKLISIIIPSYNCEDYISQCLDSIRFQTYENWQGIIIDDASSDNSVNIINEYVELDDRFLLIEIPHSGPAYARNKGMEYVKGDYLTFIDADDFIEDTLFEKALNQIEKTQSDIVIWNVDFYNNDFQRIQCAPDLIKMNNYHDKLGSKEYFNWKDNPDDIFSSFQNWAWNKMFRVNFLKQNNIHFSEDFQRTEDLSFTAESLILANRITLIEGMALTHYRINRADSAMNTKVKYPLDFLSAFLELKQWLIDNDFYDELKKSYINWAVDSAFYNLNTMPDSKNFRKVYNELKNHGFEELDAYSLEAQDFNPPFNYEQLEMVKNDTYIEFLFNKTQILDGLQSYANTMLGFEKEGREQDQHRYYEMIRKKEEEFQLLQEKYDKLSQEVNDYNKELEDMKQKMELREYKIANKIYNWREKHISKNKKGE